MPKFKVEVKEILARVVEVEAPDKDEAVAKIQDQYDNQEIVLDSGDYIETNIDIFVP